MPALSAASKLGKGPGKRKRSNEHVISDWIRELVPGVGERIVHQRSTAAGDDQMWTAEGFDIKANRVCAPCNNRWMNGLDHEAGRFFEPMIQGRGKQLHEGGQTALAAWASKTALALYLAITAKQGDGAPLDHYREIEAIKLPPQWTAVWLAAYRRDLPRVGLQIGALITLDRGGPAETHGYLVTILIGHLVAQVFGYLGHTEMAFENPVFDEAILQIWPYRSSVVWPPRNILFERDLMLFAKRHLGAS